MLAMSVLFQMHHALNMFASTPAKQSQVHMRIWARHDWLVWYPPVLTLVSSWYLCSGHFLFFRRSLPVGRGTKKHVVRCGAIFDASNNFGLLICTFTRDQWNAGGFSFRVNFSLRSLNDKKDVSLSQSVKRSRIR